MKKKIIYLSFIIVLVISLITLSCIYKSKDNKYKKEYNTIPKGMAIMIKEEGATDYIKSTSKDIPKGNYVLNRDKSYCKNNGKIGNYDSSLGKVSFSFIGTDSCYLYFDYKKETIKLGNAELVVNSETPDFSKVATTNEGLFKADDDYTATTGMKSYYFRGAVDNNWVKFGKDNTGKDIYWRIIRINGDGSIRMIYSGTTAPTESTKVVMTGSGTQIGESVFNSSYNSSEYVGYKYTLGQQHGLTNNSDIKTALENWYKTTTMYTDDVTSKIVSDAPFCYDRSALASTISTGAYGEIDSWASTGTQYYYGSYGRTYGNNNSWNPSLKCTNELDKYSVASGTLSYQVGLITADELVFAGANNNNNTSYYLYTGQYYWSGSPYYFNMYSGYSYVFCFIKDVLDFHNLNLNAGVRPVISISKDVKLSGDGTWNNVFEVEKKGYETILANNTVNETTPDFSKVTTASEKGLYAADDDYTATTGMKSYYFRGAVDNNWVKFGKDSTGKDIYWRIIRINGDGSIRMIYSGTTAPTSSTATVMTGDGTQISTTTFNSSGYEAEYVGYQYIEGQQHGYGKCNGTSASCTVNESTVYNSAIKQTIDNWYKTTTLETDIATKSIVSQDQIFCNDRSASTSNATYSNTNYTTLTSWNSTGTQYYYGADGRLAANKSPILTCPTASDKFTVNTSNGNGALTYPVGLITADEVAMAGGISGTGNSTYYLYTNQHYWLGSPYTFRSIDSSAYGFIVYSSGNLGYLSVDHSYGARPVISLSSKAKLSGSGTYNDVYTVVTNDSTEDTSSGKSFDTVFAANNTDIFPENGLRYEGADPNNYICLDNKASGTCSDNSLLFRIIGLFDEDTSTDGTSSSGTKKLLKVIDTNNYGGTDGKAWNSAGTNNWSNASLKTELNGTYLTTLLGTSNVNSKLSDGIVSAKWHLGGASESNDDTLTAEGIYEEERNTSAIYSGNPSSIYAKVGLMYPSDYGYATVGGSTTNKAGCRAQALYDWDDSSYSDCINNDWIYNSQSISWGKNRNEWLLSPHSSYSNLVALLFLSGYVGLGGGGVDDDNFAMRPTFYLDSSILKIVGSGDGTKDNAYRVG